MKEILLSLLICPSCCLAADAAGAAAQLRLVSVQGGQDPLVSVPRVSAPAAVLADSGACVPKAYFAPIQVNIYVEMPDTILMTLRNNSDQAAAEATEILLADGYSAEYWELGPVGTSYNLSFILITMPEDQIPAAAKELQKYSFAKAVFVNKSSYDAITGGR